MEHLSGSNLPNLEFRLKEHELIHIFRYLPSQVLLKLRNVAKLWNFGATPMLHKRLDIKTILSVRKTPEYLQFLQQNPGFVSSTLKLETGDITDTKYPGSESYSEILLQISTLAGFRQLIINLQACVTLSTKNILQVLGNLGGTLEILIITGIDGVSAVPLDQLPLNLKLLHTFEVQNNIFPVEELWNEISPDPYEALWTIILNSCPNIHSACLGSKKLYNQLHELGRISQLKNCRIGIGTCMFSDMDSFPDLGIFLGCPSLAIKDIKVHISNVYSEEIVQLHQLLDKQRDRLETLGLMFYNFCDERLPRLNMNFPVLKNLNLSLEDEPLSMNFSRDTPALKCLSVHQKVECGLEDWLSYEDNRNGPPCKTLEEIRLTHLINGDVEFMTYLSNTFPAVKRAIFKDCSKLTMQMLGALKWDHLEEMELYFLNEAVWAVSLDNWLFGLNEQWKSGISTQEDGWWEAVDAPESAENCISKLTNLKRLKIDGQFDNLKMKPLTDFAIYFGLSRMISLEELKINYKVSKDHVQFSLQGMDYLLKKLEKLELLDL